MATTHKLVPDPVELYKEILKKEAIEKDFKDKTDTYKKVVK